MDGIPCEENAGVHDPLSIIKNLSITLTIVILGLVLFLPVLKHWFFADDFHWLSMSIRGIESPQEILTHRFFNYHRPVVTLSFVTEHLLYGLSAPGHYLMQIILHMINTALLFQILYIVFKHRIIAFLAALMFLVSPAGIEAVLWISGRTDLLSTTLVLTALFFLLKPSGHLIRNHWIGNTAFLFAIFTKEAAIMLPAVLFLYPGTHSAHQSARTVKRIFKKIWEFRATILIAMAGLLYHGLLQWKTGPHISGYSDQLISLSWLGNIVDGAAFTVMAPFEKIFSMGLPGWVVCTIFTVLALALIKQKDFLPAKGWLLTIILMVPAALIPFDFLPEPHLTFRRFFYLPGLGAAFFWGALMAFSISRKHRLLTTIVFSFVGVTLIMSVMGTGRQIQKWEGLTHSRLQAMQQVQKTLNPIPKDEKILILLPDKSVWPEMFILFSGRPVQSEYISKKLSLDLKDTRVFTFQQGALYPVQRRKPALETSLLNPSNPGSPSDSSLIKNGL